MKKFTIISVSVIVILLFSLNFIYPRRLRLRRHYGFRTTQVNRENVLKKVKIVHLNISNFFFRSGKKLTFNVYVENRSSNMLRNVKLSFYIHRRGKVALAPENYIQTELKPNKIARFNFTFIWKETGYSTNYSYKHGDYRFEAVVTHSSKTTRRSHVIWAKPFEYMFYWSKP